jgi:hypothetical protein
MRTLASGPLPSTGTVDAPTSAKPAQADAKAWKVSAGWPVRYAVEHLMDHIQ